MAAAEQPALTYPVHPFQHLEGAIALIKTTSLLTASLVITLAACAETQTVDPIIQAVSGRTLVAGDTRLTAGANGALVGTLAGGDTLAGTWRISNGKWCRTLTLPVRFAGPEVCQDAALTDGQLVIIGSNGSPTIYTIE